VFEDGKHGPWIGHTTTATTATTTTATISTLTRTPTIISTGVDGGNRPCSNFRFHFHSMPVVMLELQQETCQIPDTPAACR
jgi:hypothetical protein